MLQQDIDKLWVPIPNQILTYAASKWHSINTMNRLFLFSTNNTSHGVWIFETYNSDKLNNAFFVFHFVQ